MPLRRRSDSQPPRRDPLTEAIARRAYELFLERGGEDGHEVDDWLQAERELLEAARTRSHTTRSED
ncbi:MAG: hypothetical protein AUF76_14030 [Acidobacteria bacterium 13_1_20CM_2_65_9]|jgi:hypothetical protein|nr:MAG: hypothetical protein AUF76_14030 [Acidobacteria bacterium 13_1_20CM_2_65_9]